MHKYTLNAPSAPALRHVRVCDCMHAGIVSDLDVLGSLATLDVVAAGAARATIIVTGETDAAE